MLINVHNDFIASDRNGIVENRHSVHAAVTNAAGTLLYAVGDPLRMTLARSAAKPAQALAILETGAVDTFNFNSQDLAFMCASNSSEDRHIARARSMLAKVDASEEDLRCGAHVPISETVQRAWIKRDFTPTPICSNCSGKHIGMIAGAKVLSTDATDYHASSHPVQIHVKRVVEDVCGLGEEGALWGLDGCNLPAPAFPLHYLARMNARFAEAADVMARGCVSSRTKAMSRVFHAMWQHPELVAGEDRFCTILMSAFKGLLIGKLGADGCYGIGVRECESTRLLGARGAIGISVKIEDGDVGVLYLAVAEILEQLKIGDPEMRQALSRFHHRKILNTVNVQTGKFTPCFQVRVDLSSFEF
ncbi:L-asparaginase II [Penicillium sp. DV-2018c]|nr:L-asparaginase II [Penicillium sp. DV-2018c]KAJ5572358.1 L-asparaginase II [Penicillium sp. DV-2018c]